MKYKFIITLALLFSCFSVQHIWGQSILATALFNDSPDKRVVSPILSNDSSSWIWGTKESIGKNIFRIISPSGGGAMLMVDTPSDIQKKRFLSFQNIRINSTAQQEVHIRFNQYLKMSAEDHVYLLIKTNTSLDTFQLNLNNMIGGETSVYDLQDINISSATLDNDVILSISFVSVTKNATWIIDDIEIYDATNIITSPKSYIGDSLTNYAIPYDLDLANWPYVPHQVVVQFYPATTTRAKEAIRNYMGFEKIGSCCNNEIELWLEQAGGANIPINELTKSDDGDDDDDSGLQDIELNKYNFNQLQNPPPTPWESLDVLPAGIPTTTSDNIVIAVLDSGVDYEHDDLKPYIWRNPSPDDCYINDFIGWNFVHDNNNPDDDHSHGTHVAGIIVDNMLKSDISCGFRIMPLKTHTFNGTSTLFDVTCATYYAINHKANVINDSWGFYGSSSKILKRAMKKALDNNILIATSSGNDGLDLDNTPLFPACDALANIVTVGSHDKININEVYEASSFSNYSAKEVDMLALGDRVLSTVPGLNGLRGVKSGTSMSSPAVAASLAKRYCKKNIPFAFIKNCIFQNALKIGTLNDKAAQGKVLGITSSCFPVRSVSSLFAIFPNPAFGEINIISNINAKDINIALYDLAGKLVYQRNMQDTNDGDIIKMAIEQLPSSIYFVHIKFDNHLEIKKFIKQ